MPLIRDTIDPTNEREVSREEALDLERMDLLFDTSRTRATTDDGLRKAAIRQVLERNAPPDREPLSDPEVADEIQAVTSPTDPGSAPDSSTADPDDSQES